MNLDDIGHRLTILKNRFAILISEQIRAEKFDDGIYFKIEKVRGKTDKTLMQRELYRMAQAMLDRTNFLMIQSQSRMEQEQKDMETLLSTFTENIRDQQDQNFSQEDNVVPKKR